MCPHPLSSPIVRTHPAGPEDNRSAFRQVKRTRTAGKLPVMKTPDNSIRAVARALELLRLLNARHGAGLREIQAASGLPKPTVFRILRTLQQEGYLEPDGIPGVYHITPKVLELSRGYTEKSLVVRIAAPIALATTRQIKWPLAIGTLDRDAIVVRYSSMPYSPLGVLHTTLGHRHRLLDSAMGHAYLIACSAAERHNLILNSTRSPRRIASTLRAVVTGADRGYGLRLPKKKGDSATLAVAIRCNSEVLAILSLTTFGKAMDPPFIAKTLPVLTATAARIEAAYVAAFGHGPQPDRRTVVLRARTQSP